MPRSIAKTACIKEGCIETSFFRRLCKPHYEEAHPGEIVYEFRFRWNIVETFEGSIRAKSREEALRLARNGIVAGKRIVFDQKPDDLRLLDEKRCM